jgi:hypothetical protein
MLTRPEARGQRQKAIGRMKGGAFSVHRRGGKQTPLCFPPRLCTKNGVPYLCTGVVGSKPPFASHHACHRKGTPFSVHRRGGKQTPLCFPPRLCTKNGVPFLCAGVVGSKLPIAYCLWPITYCVLLIAYCLLPVACCLLPVARCQLPVAYCLLPIVYCLLSITYCL